MYQADSPFKQFCGLDGLPLTGGKIYIGVVNQNPETYPAAIYWDEAGTQPAAQPLATIGGYIARNGTPARVYISADDFSMTVRNAKGSVVFTALSSTSLSTLRTDLASPSGASLAGYMPPGTGAVATSVQSKLREHISALDFGADPTGVADSTAALQNAASYCRTNRKRLYIPAGTYKVSGTIDISGLQIFGDLQGYLNRQGTIISCTSTAVIPFRQVETSADMASVDMRNIYITGAAVGVQCRYTLNSIFESVFVENSLAGFEIGNTSDSGPLYVQMRNCETNNITNIGLSIKGNTFDNANMLESCVFQGGTYAASIDCVGGIGAVNNCFYNCEFLGPQYGVVLGNTKNTVFNACYFESVGPSVTITNTSSSVAFTDCVFGSLTNTNPTGFTSFIYHNAVSVCTVSIRGGYIYIPSGAANNNLSLIGANSPAYLYVTIEDKPTREIAATGFAYLASNLISANCAYTDTGSYTPTWTGSGSNPAIGNGSIVGAWSRDGNNVTVSITVTMGSTTTYGAGSYSFGLPFPAAKNSVGQCHISSSGVGYYTAIPLVSALASVFAMYIAGGSNLVGPTLPVTFKANDVITVSFTYQV